MNRKILIIDDQKDQASNLAKKLNENLSREGFDFEWHYEEERIKDILERKLYHLAFIDVKLNGFSKNGIELAQDIIDANPLAKVVLVSSFKDEYLNEYNKMLSTGKILAFLEKTDFIQFSNELTRISKEYFEEIEHSNLLANDTLLSLFEDSTNEECSYKKGIAFERFLKTLFNSIGYTYFQKRVKDATTEIDLIIRNDIDDMFLAKFGKYILIEAKNQASKIDKDTFVLFRSKLDSSNKLIELGIIATTSSVAKTVKIESLRTSQNLGKIILLDRKNLIRLINSDNKLSEFKDIIDEQIRSL